MTTRTVARARQTPTVTAWVTWSLLGSGSEVEGSVTMRPRVHPTLPRVEKRLGVCPENNLVALAGRPDAKCDGKLKHGPEARSVGIAMVRTVMLAVALLAAVAVPAHAGGHGGGHGGGHSGRGSHGHHSGHHHHGFHSFVAVGSFAPWPCDGPWCPYCDGPSWYPPPVVVKPPPPLVLQEPTQREVVYPTGLRASRRRDELPADVGLDSGGSPSPPAG